jgi:Tol biopolymer transport system component
MKNKLLFFLLILIAKSSFGQEFTDLYGDYLGQNPPENTPVVFAPGIISRGSTEHSAAIFSSDGNQVYWVSRQIPVMNIWYMTRINNRWTKPEILPPFGDSKVCFDPFLSNDGNRLYFATGNGNVDIWFIEKQGGGWSKPQGLSSVINTHNGQCQATFTNDETVYFIDYKTINKKWTCDILKSKFRNGNYLPPVTLPACINSQTEDWTPFVAKDESYLVFSSGGDLYISFHDNKNDVWSDRINMGDSINTKTQETYPTISPDGKYLFFTRYTNETNDMDIFWVSAKIIDRLREKSNIEK